MSGIMVRHVFIKFCVILTRMDKETYKLLTILEHLCGMHDCTLSKHVLVSMTKFTVTDVLPIKCFIWMLWWELEIRFLDVHHNNILPQFMLSIRKLIKHNIALIPHTYNLQI